MLVFSGYISSLALENMRLASMHIIWILLQIVVSVGGIVGRNVCRKASRLGAMGNRKPIRKHSFDSAYIKVWRRRADFINLSLTENKVSVVRAADNQLNKRSSSVSG